MGLKSRVKKFTVVTIGLMCLGLTADMLKHIVMKQERASMPIGSVSKISNGSNESMAWHEGVRLRDRSTMSRLHACAELQSCGLKLKLASGKKDGRLFGTRTTPVRRDSFLGGVDLFQPDSAMAQSFYSAMLSMPTYISSDPSASGSVASGLVRNGTYILKYSMHSHFPGAEGKPYIALTFTAPAAGWYLIDFHGEKAKARLRHGSSGPIVANWDMHNALGGAMADYVTVEYLEAGRHQFYFWVVKHPGAPTYSPGTAIYSISVEAI